MGSGAGVRRCGAAMVLVLLVGAVLAGQAPTFRGGVDLVTFGVTVTADEAFLTDLSADDFLVI